jgi:LysR family transcriptional regulator (chromosome initiation inhibitor)
MDLQIDQLRTLVAVVDHGTLDAAARELRVTPSAVSQRLKALESSVGQVLVRRSRPTRPTEPGTVILRVARQMILLNDTAGLELTGSAAEGATTIPVVINGDSLNTWRCRRWPKSTRSSGSASRSIAPTRGCRSSCCATAR